MVMILNSFLLLLPVAPALRVFPPLFLQVLLAHHFDPWVTTGQMMRKIYKYLKARENTRFPRWAWNSLSRYWKMWTQTRRHCPQKYLPVLLLFYTILGSQNVWELLMGQRDTEWTWKFRDLGLPLRSKTVDDYVSDPNNKFILTPTFSTNKCIRVMHSRHVSASCLTMGHKKPPGHSELVLFSHHGSL